MIDTSIEILSSNLSNILECQGEINSCYTYLLDVQVHSLGDLIEWLDYCDQVFSIIEQARNDYYVKYTLDTMNKTLFDNYTRFSEEIYTVSKKYENKINQKYIDCPFRKFLPEAYYSIYHLNQRNNLKLYSASNASLINEEQKLIREYQAIASNQTFTMDGKEEKSNMLSRYLESEDRKIRKKAWVSESEKHLLDKDKLDKILSDMIECRHQIAINCDFKNYQEYAFLNRKRIDYTKEDCLVLHDTIEKLVVPVCVSLQEKRLKAFDLSSLRPWDMSINVDGPTPKYPIISPEELCERSEYVISLIDKDFHDYYQDMRKNNYFDLDNRKGKMPGGYIALYEHSRHPFIFLNTIGTYCDLRGLMHECGHAFHYYAARHHQFISYRTSPIEFAELVAMSMELFALDHIHHIFTPDDANRIIKTHLESMLRILPWDAMIDAFQHYIYSNPNHTIDERTECWLKLCKRFGGIVNYDGYEDSEASSWQRQLHIYEAPFYYIEYSIAKLGALQLWLHSKSDYPRTLAKLKKAMAFGGSKSLPELFQCAGLKFDMSIDSIAPIIKQIKEKI